MSRLTKRIGNRCYINANEIPLACDKPKFCNRRSCKFAGDYENCPFLKMIGKLAEIEDKTEAGTMIELPCKVGDTIYRIWNCGKHGKSISEFVVKHIDIDHLPDIEVAFLHKQSMSGCYHFAKLKDFGKIVFLTREEAEKALAERSDG